MKKTLTLLTLLGAIATAPLNAKEVWWKGVTHDPETRKMEGAITTYKHLYPGDSDSGMCWVAAACNVIAWWQDQVEQNGALIIPKEAPRDYDVFEKERHLWPNDGGFSGKAIQMWLTGADKLQMSPIPGNDATAEGLTFQGYYPRLAGAALNSANYKSTFGANPDTMRQKPIYKQYEYTMIQTYWFLPSNYDIDDPDKTRYQWASEKIVEFMENDWGVCWATNTHAMTVYGVELDENGLITKFFNSDNNYPSAGYDCYTELSISMGTDPNNYGSILTSYQGSAPTLSNICAIRTTGIRFLDYDVRVGENIVDEDEFLFSHYCNLIVDGADDYKLQYDLRDADVEGSPVDAKKVNLVTYDEGLSYEEQYTDEKVPTGHLHLQGGQVTLVDCDAEREQLDVGGRVEGTISFEDSKVAGTNRTLKVDRTDTIAKEINLSATSGTNTLEVTDGNTASFGTLSGTGDLDKTGAGSAEVTEAVTLMGEIRVHEGSFIFGTNATITGDTSLSISSNGQVLGAGDRDIKLTINSGVHVNNGELALTTTVAGGTLKGSGTFAMVTIDGGEMIVGNSPGHQEFTDTLTLTSGRLVFCATGLETPNAGDSAGWESGTYSTINMNGNEFVVNPEGKIVIALSGDAANSLTTANGTLELTLATGLKSGAFTEEQLAALAEQTSFELSVEDGAGTKGLPELNAPQFSYKMVENALVLTTGISGATPAVPEPTTGTLSLLALAALCARRRRK